MTADKPISPEAAMLMTHGLRRDVAEDLMALRRIQADGLRASHNPTLAAPWLVGEFPRNDETDGEGDSIAEALAQHIELRALAARDAAEDQQHG